MSECVKIVLVGKTGAGKTSYATSVYNDGNFNPEHRPTIGVDFKLSSFKLKNGKEVKVQLWDAAGKKRFRSLVSTQCFMRKDVIVVMYDMTSEKSLLSVHEWIHEVRKLSSETPIVICGNKCDAPAAKRVSAQAIEALKQQCNVLHFECSAKEKKNVNQVFQEVLEIGYKHMKASEIAGSPSDSFTTGFCAAAPKKKQFCFVGLLKDVFSGNIIPQCPKSIGC